MKRVSCLAVDFGGVIIPSESEHGEPHGSFLDLPPSEAVRIPPQSGCLESLRRLVCSLSGNVWVVSKASPATEHRTWAWFRHNKFFQETGINPSNVRFSRTRQDKAEICKEIGITDHSHLIGSSAQSILV